MLYCNNYRNQTKLLMYVCIHVAKLSGESSYQPITDIKVNPINTKTVQLRVLRPD